MTGAFALPAQAAPDTSTAPATQPGSFWGVEIDRTSYPLLGPRFIARLRNAGVNTLVVRPGALSPSRTARVRTLAARGGLEDLVPVVAGAPPTAGTIAAANAACTALKIASIGSRCAVYARTLASARAIADLGAADVVLAHATLGQLKALRAAPGRIVAAVVLPASGHLGKASWRRAVLLARSGRAVDLAARLHGRKPALGAFLGTLRPVATAGDRRVPSMPQGLTTTDLTGSTTGVVWSGATDNRGVAGYGVYLDGVRIRDVTATAASLPALPCDGARLIEVDAVDGAGNRSRKHGIKTSPGTCTPPPSTGLVAAYGFDEASGTGATDASGQGNHGTLSGAARTATGRYGRALSFDGVNDLVAVPDGASLDLTAAMTLEAWVRPSAAGGGWRTVILKEQPGDLVYGLYAAATGSRPSGHVFVGGNDARVAAPVALPATSWSHLATTYDGSSLRLYVNGDVVDTVAVTGLITASTGLLRIGGNTIWNEWFAGSIDEVRVYDRALTDVQIRADMANPIGPPAAADTSPPTTPITFRVTGATATTVSLAWDASADDTGVTGYGVYRNGVLAASPVGTSVTVSGLTCGTSYPFAVDAVDAAGNRSGQATLVGATSACPSGPDTEAPTTPAGLAKTSSTQTSISVSWTASSDNVGVTGYGAYRNSAPAGNPTGTSYTFTGLTCGTSYTLAVDAADAAGNRSAQTSITAVTAICPVADTQAPAAPGNFRATGQAATSVSLAWDAATDNVGVTGYGVYRGGALEGSPTGLTTTVSGLACGTSYAFAVDAVDAAGNRSAQATLSGSTSACPPPGTADLYVATTGSSSSACTQAAPCSTFNRAYTVAQPGTTVQVAAGSYPGQTINAAPKPEGSAPVVFAPAGGAVTISSFRVNQGGAIELRDFTITGDTYNGCNCPTSGQAGSVVREITYRRIKMEQFFVRGADKVSYIDSEAGPNGADDGMNWITAAYQTNDGASDVLLDGVRIHDFSKHNTGAHVDCIGIDDVDGLVVRNTRIWNCEHFSIIFGKDLWSFRAARDVLLENNFFDCCYSGYYSLGFGDVEGPMMVRFNSMTLGMGWLGGTVAGATFDSNVISTNNSGNCSNATWRYNVVGSGSACGGGGAVAATSFLAPPTDLHLGAGATAINFGNPTDYPATDIDGQARGGNRPDAGADERG